ncbi:MAG: methylenetetrahydrofolate reductase [NAD(P)H] [Vulcanimicrobiaceae bacterium]
MKIAELLGRGRPTISFEFFPPKSEAGVAQLLETIGTLRALGPAFVSVTYGAGGSSRTRTVEVVTRIKHELGIEPLAHVTCIGSTAGELRALFGELASSGVENVMLLRGDRPSDGAPPRAEELRYATELIALAAGEFSFSIGAAAYPQVHPEASSAADDLANAIRKVAAGAQFLVTQFFFENEAYFGYVERLRHAGVGVPVIPGIMPIVSYEGIARMVALSGAPIPAPLQAALDARRAEPEAIAELGVAYCALQCRALLSAGAPGLHFYTLNRSPATRAVVSALVASGVLEILVPT